MVTRQMKIPFGPLRNSNLFSNHWLEHRLSLEPEWTECRPFAVRLLGQLAELWRQQKNRVDQYTEPSLEEAFIQPVFKKLGWTLLYQPFLRGRKPDYALFFTEQDLDKALSEGRKSPAFWAHATIVADAKAWTVNLDRPAIINNQREYPPEQIESYIHHSQKDYGILTNGRLWRLYPHNLSPHQPRFNTYFECDLAAMLERWTSTATDGGQRTFAEDKDIIEDFLTFYLFFSPLASTTIQARKPLIQRAIEGSNEYRLGIGEGLKGRVFEALRICMEGFFSHKPNELGPERDLGVCKEQSLILLYRLLFIMYAEDRELLPFFSNRLYRENRSLGRIRDQVAAKLDRIEQGTEQDFDRTSQDLWDALSSLFNLIDKGGTQYGVPPYNGGLFDPEENRFLNEKALPDWYFVRVLDQLGRSPDAEHPDAGLFRVDYRDLSIQHLGHIYEGLLELQPNWAEEPMIVVRKTNHQKSSERVIPASNRIPKGYKYTGIRYETDRVYLVTDKGERRATGSYYTPDYIVNYIVSQTLGPLCQQISETLAAEIKGTEKQFKRARGRNRQLLNDKLRKLQNDFDDRVLQLKVLDPAMGSGHFLLRACQYLAEEIATNPNTGDPVADQLQEDESVLIFWKRRIVEHCLYGVDKNPLAVELAKVALWLETAAIGQPLAFLDHHLRCGNSLIGGWVADLGALPGVEPLPLFEQKASSVLPSVIEGFKAIAGKPSDTRGNVKIKTQIYNQTIDRVRKPFVTVADLWCATFFLDKANQITPDQYQQALQTLGKPAKQNRLLKTQWFKQAVQVARQPDVACFHWELEFPDVFFDLSGRRPEAGFDAVIGNPPYGAKFTNDEIEFLAKEYDISTKDSAAYFLEKACKLTKGSYGMIVPKSISFYNSWKSIRNFLFSNSVLTCVGDVGLAFEKVNYEQIILCFKKNKHVGDITINVAEPTRKFKDPKTFFEDGTVPNDIANITGAILFRGISQREERVLKKVISGSTMLGDICKESFRALYISDSEKSHLPSGQFRFVNKVPDVGRYELRKVWKVDLSVNKKWLSRAKKCLKPKIFFKVLRGKQVIAYPDPDGLYIPTEKLVVFCLDEDKFPISYFTLAGIINSKVPSYVIQRILFSKTRETSRVMDLTYSRYLPIPRLDFENPEQIRKHDRISTFVEQMLDLHKKLAKAKVPDEKTQIQRQINTTDSQIDRLVYKLYDLTPEEIKIVEEV